MAPERAATAEVTEVLREIASNRAFVDELKSDRLVSALERQILSGRLRPGDRLPTEGELCEYLNVSRSVIRDAVRVLVARGLVTVRQGRGMSVAVPTDAAFSQALLVLLARSDVTMADVVQARATIETRFVGLAATSGTEEEWTELEATLERFRQAIADDDDDATGRAHLAFHIGIIGAIHQPALDLMLKPLTEIILVTSDASLVTPDDWEFETHRPILDALRARDAGAAEAAMVNHFSSTTSPAPQYPFLARRFTDAYFNGDGGAGSS